MTRFQYVRSFAMGWLGYYSFDLSTRPKCNMHPKKCSVNDSGPPLRFQYSIYSMCVQYIPPFQHIVHTRTIFHLLQSAYGALTLNALTQTACMTFIAY